MEDMESWTETPSHLDLWVLPFGWIFGKEASSQIDLQLPK